MELMIRIHENLPCVCLVYDRTANTTYLPKPILQMKRNVFHYCTGALFDQKHAVRFCESTSLQSSLCQQADSALHILSECQHAIISGMITERHNVACRLIMKAISKGSLTGRLVHLMPNVINIWPNKIFKSLSMLMIGQYPAGFLVLVDLLEIDYNLVALMPF